MARKFVSNDQQSFQFVRDQDLQLADLLNGNVSTARHGFTPKLSGDYTQFLNGVGGWTTPSGRAADESWIPLVDGSEPPAFITDGAGVLILVAYP